MGAWQEIADYTVPSNTTSVTLNNFGTITKDDFVKFKITYVNSSGSTGVYDLFPNGNTTGSNYHSQLLSGSGSTASAVRFTYNEVAQIDANGSGTTSGFIKLSENDRYNHFANTDRALSSNVRLTFYYTTSSGATFSSGITSLTLVARGGTIGTGSRIQIYKLAAEKVADITVASNTTQVDISNLSIDKDSEYLLVSDWLSPGNNPMYLAYNDQTTLTNYYYQYIIGTGTTAAAARANSNFSWYAETGRKAVVHSHIKLSNIGAFTSQNYSFRNAGTNEPYIQHHFVSSTAENITSITKLNIYSGTNAIAAGSRFILYKLY